MNEQATDALVRRLERLERQNHIMKRIGSLLMLRVATALLLGQSQCNSNKSSVSAQSNTVEAQEFVLRDTNGKARLKIGVTSGLGPELSFLDVTGTKRLCLFLHDLGAGQGAVAVNDKDGRTRILLRENLISLADRKE